ncbi:MAG: histidinol dehydrogenase, partial [Acidimicrobiaceae bacterium]
MAFVLSRIDLRGVADLRGRLPRPPLAGDESEVVAAVRAILSDVRQRGDAAVRELTHRFDGVAVEDLVVPEAEVKRALEAL